MSTPTTTAQLAPPALTTIFTPPSYCLSTLSSYYSRFSTFFELAPISTFPECYPSSATAGLTFSPGICPDGYVSVDQTLTVLASTNIETEIRCCPRAFSLTYDTRVNSCRISIKDSIIDAPTIVARYQSTDTAVASAWSSLLGKSYSPPAQGFSGLGAGSIAGIVVGAIAGFLLLLGGLILLLRWRKRKQTAVIANLAEGRKWGDDSQQTKWEEAGESRRM